MKKEYKIEYDFWKKWKRKTTIEKKAIVSIKKSRSLILKSIPKNKIVAIYIKGSFVRREMNKKSDVDIVPIVKYKRLKEKIIKFDKKNREHYRPSELLPQSIMELKEKPDPFIERLNEHKLVYGKPLSQKDFPFRDNKKRLKSLIYAFRHLFFPDYEKGIFKFSALSKQVFGLTDLEERIKGKNPPKSWKYLTKSIKNKKHIIHDAWKLRKNPTKDKLIRKKFIIRLKKHLKQLEKELK